MGHTIEASRALSRRERVGTKLVYRRILLVSDGSREGLVALREGAVIACSNGAPVRLLVVQSAPAAVWSSEDSLDQEDPDGARRLLDRGLERLRRLGLDASGEIRVGEPTSSIAQAAREFGADLVVVGHRRQSLLDRWWSGSSGGYLVGNVDCSVLIARDVLSDAEFEALVESHAA